MKAARRAGRQALATTKQRVRHRRGASTNIAQKACYDFTHDNMQMLRELGLQTPTRHHPWPDANGIENPSNKRLHKLD